MRLQTPVVLKMINGYPTDKSLLIACVAGVERGRG